MSDRDRPNLVFVWTDQQAARTTGAYGNDRIETPNLDRLADAGTTFERAYCTSPICSPSRSSVLTGKYPHATGVTENNVPLGPDDATIAELVDEEYVAGWIGKWHLGDEVFRQRGFDEWVSTEDQYRPFYGSERPDDAHSDYHEFLLERGYEPDQVEDDGYEWFSRAFVASEVPEEHSKPAFMAERAIDFLERHRDEPFLLHVMFLEPHDPYTGPRDDQYDPADVPLPPNFDHDGLDDQPLRYRFAREAIRRGISRRLPDTMGTPPSEADWREVISNYWGLVSLVDTHAGRVFDALDAEGLADDTITVFTSDHGDMMGSHQLYTKMTQFEEAIRVPLLIRFPDGTAAGERVERPVSQVDLAPTLLDAMDQPVPEREGLQGESWLPFLRGDGDLGEYVVVEWNGANFHGVHGRRPVSRPSETRPGVDPGAEALLRDFDLTEAALLDAYTDPARTIIDPDGWKLTFRRSGAHELYDLGADPHETENLTGDRPDVVDDLYGELIDWQVRTRDPVSLSVPRGQEG
jgi:arylsulfatase A-like enzyme